MHGAVDAGLIMEVAEMEKKEIEELKGTEEGRAELARRKAVNDCFDNIPDGAKAYQLVKLARHHKPENNSAAPLRVGEGGKGYVRVFTDELVKFTSDIEKAGIPEDERPDFPGLPWEYQAVAKPKIGSVFMVSGLGNWLRTSLVRAYYVHDDPEGYRDHPDKLILPRGFPLEATMNLPVLKTGDMVISTMNSLYLCRALSDSYNYEKPVQEETAA